MRKRPTNRSTKRPDWSRRLPRALVIPKVMTLTTLADVRELMRHLPAGHLDRVTWRVVADDLEAAARGADPAEVAISLRMVLMLEHVEVRL